MHHIHITCMMLSVVCWSHLLIMNETLLVTLDTRGTKGRQSRRAGKGIKNSGTAVGHDACIHTKASRAQEVLK